MKPKNITIEIDKNEFKEKLDIRDGLDGKDGKDGDKGENGAIPDHKWLGTKLAFEKPNGEWGDLVDLRGKEGKSGATYRVFGGGSQDLTPYAKLTDLYNYIPYSKVIDADIISQSGVVYSYAHGTAQKGDIMFVGTRTAPATLTRFNDTTDLTDYDNITLTGYNNLESLVYDTVNDKLYGYVWNNDSHLRILEINPDTLVWSSVFDSAVINGGASASIITDGVYVYVVTFTNPAKFVKIRISDWSIVAQNTWTNGYNGHAIGLLTFDDRTELYATSSGSSAYLAKINAADLTYSEVALGIGAITDDLCFDKVGNYAYVYVGSENPDSIVPASSKMARVKTDDMTVTPFWGKSTYGVKCFGNDLYNLSLDGMIIKYPDKDITNPKIFLTDGKKPNEMFYAGGKFFFTDWTSNARLYEVEFPEEYVTNGVDSYSIGRGSNASGLYGVSIGFDSLVSGDFSYAFGSYNEVTGNGSFGIGNNTTVTSKNSIAIGNGVKEGILNLGITNDVDDSILIGTTDGSGSVQNHVRYSTTGTEVYSNIISTSNIEANDGFFVNNEPVVVWEGNTLGAKKLIGTIDDYDIGFKTNNTEVLTITANQKLGINNTDPTALLDIVTLSNVNPIRISGAFNQSATIRAQSTVSTGFAGMNMYDESEVLSASFAYGNTGASSFTNEFVLATRKSTTAFKIYQGGTGATNERIRVDASANIALLNAKVGIGTTTPNNSLHIVRNITNDFTATLLRLQSTGTLSSAFLQIDRTSTARMAGINYALSGTTEWFTGTYYKDGSGQTNFGIGTDYTAVNQKLIITSTGNVGIGTTSPVTGSILDVYGTARIGKSINAIGKTLTVSGNITHDRVSNPTNAQITGITVTNGGAGSIPAGTYYYCVMFSTAEGDTGVAGLTYSTFPTITSATPFRTTLSNIPVSTDPRVTSRKVYRSQAGTVGDFYYLYLIGTINDNTTTTFSDNTTSYTSTDWMYNKNNTTAGIAYVGSSIYTRLGDYVTAFGNGAFGSLTRGSTCAAFGSSALVNCTSGDSNQAFGHSALSSLTTGNSNVGMGYASGQGNQTGSGNVSVGTDTLRNNLSQSYTGNTAIGTQSLGILANSNNYNSALGYASGYNAQGSYGVYIGYFAGRQNTATSVGSGNIVIGYASGSVLGSGNYNVLIGYDVELGSPNTSSQLNIGNIIYGTGMGTGSTASATGKVGIGTDSLSTSKLTVADNFTVKGIASSGTNIDLLTASAEPKIVAKVSNTDEWSLGINSVIGSDAVSLFANSKKIILAGSGTTLDIETGGGETAVHIGESENAFLVWSVADSDSFIKVDTVNYKTTFNLGDVGIGIDPTEKLHVNGNILSTGYINGKKSGVFAYLTASATTTITSASTYYYIAGTFTNSPIENFTAVADPAIRYDGTMTQYFEIDWHASVSADVSGTTVWVGVKKNGTLVSSSVMNQYCKNLNELYNISGTCVVELAQNDKIQLVVTSDGSGDVITFDHFTTTINEFFD